MTTQKDSGVILLPAIEDFCSGVFEYRIVMHLCRRKQDGFLPASSREIAAHCRISWKVTKQCLEALVGRGVVQVSEVKEEDVVNLLRQKQPGKFPCGSQKVCEWCGYAGPAMNEHHYPVSAADGGKETVTICPNCHQEFHALLESRLYEVTDFLGGGRDAY